MVIKPLLGIASPSLDSTTHHIRRPEVFLREYSDFKFQLSSLPALLPIRSPDPFPATVIKM